MHRYILYLFLQSTNIYFHTDIMFMIGSQYNLRLINIMNMLFFISIQIKGSCVSVCGAFCLYRIIKIDNEISDG